MQPPPGYNYGPPPPQGSPGVPMPPNGPPSGASAFPGYQPQYPPGYHTPPGTQPFVPPTGFAPQSYSPQQPAYGQQMPQQYQQYAPPQFQQQPPPPQPSTAAGGMGSMGTFMNNLSPLNLMTGGLLSGPQQFMQQRMGALVTTMTGSTMHGLFNISSSYVTSKLLMLMTPFLPKWTYTRQAEQIAGGQKYRPPSMDVNAPDLFIPLMAAWAYALLCCVVAAMGGKFKPDLLSSTIYSACLAWFMHWLAARVLLKGMNVSGVPWSELAAYTGYSFVQVCISIVAGCIGGRAGYYVTWAVGSTFMAIFMVKTMKRVIFQETRQYGTDLRLINYLLLALALFQYPWALWLGVRPPTVAAKVVAKAAGHAL